MWADKTGVLRELCSSALQRAASLLFFSSSLGLHTGKYRPYRELPKPSLEAEVGGRGSLAAGYSAHKKAQSRPGFGLLKASVLTSNREEKQLVL